MLAYAFFILFDEWLKEGYLIYPPDLAKPGTHEFLLWLGEAIMLIYYVLSSKKYGENCRKDKGC